MFWKRFFIVFGVLIILAFIAQLLAAPYLKRLLIKGAKESLGVEMTISECALSVLKRNVVLNDVTVMNPERPGDYLIKAKEVNANFYLLPFLFNRYILNSVAITGPEAILYLDESGKLKIPQFKKKEGAAKGGGELLFRKLVVTEGNLKFIDQRVSNPATITQFSSIGCEVVNSVSFSGRTVITGVNLKGKIEGQGSFSVDGKGRLVEKPLNFDGRIKIENVPIPKFAVYYSDVLPVKIKKGSLFIDTKAVCNKGNLNVKSDVRIQNLDLEPIGDPLQTVLLELKTTDVISFLKREDNSVNFSFEINGDLSKPGFKWGAEMSKAFVNSLLRAFAEGIMRLYSSPAKAGELIGNMLGGDAGEAAKRLGDKLEKILGK